MRKIDQRSISFSVVLWPGKPFWVTLVVMSTSTVVLFLVFVEIFITLEEIRPSSQTPLVRSTGVLFPLRMLSESLCKVFLQSVYSRSHSFVKIVCIDFRNSPWKQILYPDSYSYTSMFRRPYEHFLRRTSDGLRDF